MDTPTYTTHMHICTLHKTHTTHNTCTPHNTHNTHNTYTPHTTHHTLSRFPLLPLPLPLPPLLCADALKKVPRDPAPFKPSVYQSLAAIDTVHRRLEVDKDFRSLAATAICCMPRAATEEKFRAHVPDALEAAEFAASVILWALARVVYDHAEADEVVAALNRGLSGGVQHLADAAAVAPAENSSDGDDNEEEVEVEDSHSSSSSSSSSADDDDDDDDELVSPLRKRRQRRELPPSLTRAPPPPLSPSAVRTAAVAAVRRAVVRGDALDVVEIAALVDGAVARAVNGDGGGGGDDGDGAASRGKALVPTISVAHLAHTLYVTSRCCALAP